jgi:hypothetical protein
MVKERSVIDGTNRREVKTDFDLRGGGWRIVDGVVILIRRTFGSKKKRIVGASIGFAAPHGFWRVWCLAGAWLSHRRGLVEQWPQ